MDVYFVMHQRDCGFLQVVSTYTTQELAKAAAEVYTQKEIKRIHEYEGSNEFITSALNEDGRPKYVRFYVDSRPLLNALE